MKYTQKDIKCAENHFETLTVCGHAPIGGAGEIHEYSVDTACRIADYSGSGEEREEGFTDNYGLLRGQSPIVQGWIGGGFADAAWTIATCLSGFAGSGSASHSVWGMEGIRKGG